jgi:hypothetical protein
VFCNSNTGGGGGGGGAGGAPGTLGTGASAGGSSIAVAISSATVNAQASTLRSINGGQGGTGGTGGNGGTGGIGGLGGPLDTDSGAGGNGGTGGAGGRGGHGGGGAGGWSAAVLRLTGGAFSSIGTFLSNGSPGSGGISAGNPGANGTAGINIAASLAPDLVGVSVAPYAAHARIVTAANTVSTLVTPLVAEPEIGQSHVISIESQPLYGTAIVSGNQLRYTPSVNFQGLDAFRFRATDAGGGSPPSVVGICVVFVGSTTVCPPGECAGDLNSDNVVDGSDLSILLSTFGTSCTP